LQKSNNSVIAFVTAYENDRGIRLQDGTNASVHDNIVHDNIQAGIYFAGQAVPGMTNSSIVDNQSYNNLNNGILVVGGENITVEGNDVHDNWNAGIMIWYPSEMIVQDNVIDGNNLYAFNGEGNLADAMGAGIYVFGNSALGGSFGVNILDNQITNNQQGRNTESQAIRFEGATNSDVSTVDGNNITGHDVAVNVDGHTVNVTGNTVDDVEVVGVRAVTAGVSLTGNTFVGTMPVNGKWFEGDSSYAPSITAIYAANTFPTAVTVRDSGGNYQPSIWANIQGGVNAANATDILHAYKGQYNELVTVNKTMTLEGAQNGVDARTRSVGDVNEAWIQQGVSVTADNVVLDGFLVDNSGVSVPSLGSAAIYLTNSNSGYQIVNNIVRDNIFGLYLNSSGANPTLVQHNLFDSNNRPGSAGGTGIYSDAGAANVTVDENKFTGHTSASINFAGTQSNIAITDNTLVNDATIVLFGGSNGAVVSGNSLTGTNGSGIFVGGGNSNVSITGNTLTDGHSTGISVGSVSANTNVSITNNTINQDIAQLTSTSAGTTRNMISVSNAAGSTTIDGNSVTFSGGSYGTNVVAARAINVQSTSNAVTVSNNVLNGGSAPATTGIRGSSVTTLNLTDNSIAGFTSGGSLSTVGTVNYTTTSGADTFLLTGVGMSHNANQAIGYTAVTTLNVYTLGDNDVIDINGAGAGLTTWVDAGAGTDTLNWQGSASADDVRFITAPTVGAFAASEAVYYASGAQRVNMAGTETRRIRTLGGDDNIVYERLGGSVATGFIIESGDDNDSVVAGLGNDTILGGNGADRLDGANGNDSIDGEAGDDIVFGGVGNDVLIAGSGENQLFGQNGNDTIFAQNGNLDFIDGGAGLDSAEIDSLDLISSIETII
jgi:parallel beta-helix repeat protein